MKEYEKLRRLKHRFGTPYVSRGDSSPRFNGTFSDRTNYMKMRCTSETENGSTMMMHRQQLVLQAPVATCSVDSSSHESLMESLSDRSTTCAFDYSNSAICAQTVISRYVSHKPMIATLRPQKLASTNPYPGGMYNGIKIQKQTKKQRRNEDAYGSELALLQSLQLCL